MELHAEKLSAALSKINNETTENAKNLHETGKSTGRLKPLTAGFSAFISSFTKNENRYNIKNRITDSYLASFAEFVKYLKLLRLNKRF